jgi:hypothetical protein
MESHQHPMADSIARHEHNLTVLYDARSAEYNPDVELDVEELDALGVDVDDIAESADGVIGNYALDASTTVTLTVTLAIGGPTQYLSAPIEKHDRGYWERVGPITYVDSWAVPSETTVSETTVSDVTNLAAFFDSFVETYCD